MADENETGAVAETNETEAPAVAAEPKKQRAPRRTPEEMAAAAAAKSQKASGRKAAAPVRAAKATAAVAPSAGKSSVTAKPKPVVEPKQVAQAPVTASDEMSDLLQLEEENKGLRKALSEKLRAENADLRRKLGQA